MRCLSPRTVGFKSDGKTISWSPRHYSKEYATFQLPCSKCIECRLEYARQWAVRCVHEAQMHEQNSFVTLTYDDQHLKPRLDYRDFQLFVKKLRRRLNDRISYFATGEYGEKTKRPHWHVVLFNYSPPDANYHRTTDRGDRVYKSSLLEALWANGHVELGSVTFESAGYCARYAAKKLVHGKDNTHEYDPISRKSSHRAIGRSWIEKYWPDAFNLGGIVLPDGSICSIPRYYEKWLQKHQPEAWIHYVTNLKQKRIQEAQARTDRETQRYFETMDKRSFHKPNLITHAERRGEIIKEKFKRLQQYLKGDI